MVAVEARECMEALAEVRDRRAAANGSVLYVDNDEPSGDVGQGCGVSYTYVYECVHVYL